MNMRLSSVSFSSQVRRQFYVILMVIPLRQYSSITKYQLCNGFCFVRQQYILIQNDPEIGNDFFFHSHSENSLTDF